jgi:hypothetical protein
MNSGIIASLKDVLIPPRHRSIFSWMTDSAA